MRITYYGTAAGEGFPGLFCNCSFCTRARLAGGKNIKTRSQSMINDDLLIDFPADTMLHRVLYGMDLTNVKTLLFSHAHGDHCVVEDLESMRESAAHGRDIILDVYGNEAVRDRILSRNLSPERRDLRFDYTVIESFSTVHTNGYAVTALPANHDKNQRCLMYLIEKDGKSVLYGHDSGTFFPEVVDWLAEHGKRADLVSMDGTTGVRASNGYHMGLPNIIEQKQELIGRGIADEKTVFVMNHLSHNGGVIHDELEPLAKEAGLILSYDGMVIDF